MATTLYRINDDSMTAQTFEPCLIVYAARLVAMDDGSLIWHTGSCTGPLTDYMSVEPVEIGDEFVHYAHGHVRVTRINPKTLTVTTDDGHAHKIHHTY